MGDKFDISNDPDRGPGATIVSAFMININYRADRNYDRYFELAKQFMKVPVNKIIFLEKNKVTCMLIKTNWIILR